MPTFLRTTLPAMAAAIGSGSGQSCAAIAASLQRRRVPRKATAMEPRVTLITLGVADLPRAERFYTTGLGWERSPIGGGAVVFLRTTGTVLALFPREELAADAGLPAQGDGFHGFSLAHNVREPEEVERILDLAVRAGGTLVHAPIEREWGGRSGYFADPDGFLWEVAWNPHFPFAPDGSVRIP